MVGVCSNLISPNSRDSFTTQLKEDQEKIRKRYAENQDASEIVSIETAREFSFKVQQPTQSPTKPNNLGVTVLDNINLDEVISYIDWSPFFWTWEIKGLFPQVLKHSKWGKQANELYQDAKALLQRIVDEKRFAPKAVIGLWPANRSGDDVTVYSPSGDHKIATLHFLRQQRSISHDH